MLDNAPISISARMLGLVAEIDEFKGAWRSLGRLAPDRLRALRRVATIESVGSSTRIEGSQLSDQEVDRLLSNLAIGTFETRDEQEVAGYARVMETVFESHPHMPFSESVIRQLHRDLLEFSEKDARHRGAYKTASNSVEAFDADGRSLGVVFQTASPFDTPRRMAELLAWWASAESEGELHPLLRIGVFVVVFLEIHPFQDGNGRLSRILTTLLLLQAGYAFVPFSSLETVVEENKEQYYLSLRRTQGTIRTESPDWEPWLLFFLEALQRQKNRLERKLEHEHAVFAALPERSLQIMAVIREHGQASVGQLVDLTGGNRSTIKLHLKQLVEAGHLVPHGRGRGTWYAET